ncbi:MAG TPA: dihydroneopterin aldolase [Rhodocyclaceae bacterium]
MDIITLEALRAETLLGVYPRERVLAQTVEIDLAIGFSSASAGASDDLADTIDYAEVVTRIRGDLAASRFHLLEALAEHVASLLLAEFGASWVRVSVTKLGVIPGVRRVGLTIERSLGTGLPE